jgi:hypothetical protein
MSEHQRTVCDFFRSGTTNAVLTSGKRGACINWTKLSGNVWPISVFKEARNDPKLFAIGSDDAI